VSPVEHRARFDATVILSNGGGLDAQGFRIDAPGPRMLMAEYTPQAGPT
jgi:hypothetical protein